MHTIANKLCLCILLRDPIKVSDCPHLLGIEMPVPTRDGVRSLVVRVTRAVE